MPKLSLISIAQAGLSPRSIYHLLLATNLGTGIWVSFVGGVIMYKNLPRPVFGNVQRKVTTTNVLLDSIQMFHLPDH